MPLFDGIKCELCPKIKNESNHWYITIFDHKRIEIRPFDLTDAKALRDQGRTKFHILCGPACLISDVNSLLEKINVTHDLRTTGCDPEPGQGTSTS